MNRPIKINFIAFAKQNFSINIFRRQLQAETFDNDKYNYHSISDVNGERKRYEVSFQNTEAGFEEYKLNIKVDHDLVAKRIYSRLYESCKDINGCFVKKTNDVRNKRIHFIVDNHPKGEKCVWIEPYFLRYEQKWGILIGFQFVVNENISSAENFTLDKEILIASGALNSKGQSNSDYYLFRHDYLKRFTQDILPQIAAKFGLGFTFELQNVQSYSLQPKEYYFKDNYSGSSSYFGLSKVGPLNGIADGQYYRFIYLEKDREYAVSLLKGLRGETHPTTFGGMEKLFRVKFDNDVISGIPLKDFSDIDKEIKDIIESAKSVLPIIITNSRKMAEDDELYYSLKNKFTNAGIACQIVTKDLIQNEMSLRYSLSNIGLQVFAKCGGKPWKMKPAGDEYLIIGIGQSYNVEKQASGNIIEKNITYSILTDSSGIFKDIQILSEGVEKEDSYWEQLIDNISSLILTSQSKRVALHAPFRLSKSKILEPVSRKIGLDVELSVLVINDKNDFFGFDYANNGLVPYEGTFIKLSRYDYLVWFEGIQPTNPKINRRFGNPLLVKFWYSNKPELSENVVHREILLQDCINLSGANWRGFKAKQLPVSIFYCQRIAEFIAKFRQYNLDHFEINNLKPWFL
ncbi:hypothetical protein [Chitinophaga hostae]|uniref:hypothetical protein n=1 Tax=Chitinophaga hostae TaxID=2831022 RepID=UPI003F69AF56